MSHSEALRELLYSMADDDLIVAHRNSEWTGIGPILEEDIAFSSIAQDKLGHSQALYTLLHTELGEEEPDSIAFGREESQFTCCRFVELPLGDYAFSLIRHLLFDLADQLRFESLETSSWEPLARLARKVRGEIKYHLFHAVTWVRKLGAEGSEESRARMQSALNEAFPYALGIFEPRSGDGVLVEEGIYPGEDVLRERWRAALSNILGESNLRMPEVENIEAEYGGRRGHHTEHLAPLLEEMTEVFRIDPEATW